MSVVVPQKVRFTGENSFLCLRAEEGGAETTTSTHWRGLISPAGPGHVLFLKSDATDGEIRAYSDNEDFARFIQTPACQIGPTFGTGVRHSTKRLRAP